MKKKNGFTLVELLITITLMLTILVLAIISFNRVSKNKKEESWETVKLQVEAAAKDYFIANEYLFEGLSDNSSGSITVGKLVEEDYLGKVIDPRYGTSLDECLEVNVKKEGSKYIATYTGNLVTKVDGKCENKKVVEVKEPGAPNIIGITVSKLDDKNDPYNNWYQDGAKFTLNVQTAGNGAISSILSCKTTNGYCEATESNGKTVAYEPGTSDPQATVCFSVTNASNKTSKKCATANIDNSFPDCIVSKNPNSNGWINKNVTITGKCKEDTGSLCKKDKTEVTTTISNNSPDSGTTKSPGWVEDNVGHRRDCDTATVYVDKTSPTCNLEVSSNNMMSNGWYLGKTTFTAKKVSSDVKKWIYYTDQWNKDTEHTYNGGDITGPNMTGSGNRTVTVSLTDRAGNVGTCSKNVRIYNNCDEVTYIDGNTCSEPCGGGTKNRLAYDKYTGARCSSKDEKTGGSKCNTQSCTTKNVCSNIEDYVSISSKTTRTLNGDKHHTKADGSNYTYVDFNFNISNSKIKKVETHAAFCGDKDTCLDVKTSNKDQTQVQCFSKWNCESGWEYVGASIKVKCDNTTKTLYYSHQIGTKKTWTNWK